MRNLDLARTHGNIPVMAQRVVRTGARRAHDHVVCAQSCETEFRHVARIVEEAFRQAVEVTEQAAKATDDGEERMALLADAIRCGELGLRYLRVLAGSPPPF